MKASYKTRDGCYMVQCEGETVKDLVRGIAALQDVFEAAHHCGKCGAATTRFRVRNVGGNEFFEVACLACPAVLDLGQNKKGGGLWPKQWRTFQGETGSDAPAPRRN